MKNIFLYILTVTVNSFSFATTYHVKPTGNDSNNGTSFGTAFLTIQTATDLVAAGDSVWVYDGNYKGFDHFYKNSGTASDPIVYMAKGLNVVITQDCGRGYDGLNIEGNDYIIVDGFKVSKISHTTGSGEDGIRAVIADHITIRNCNVDSCYRGIFTGYTDYITIENNTCTRSFGEHGIYVSNNSDHIILRFNSCSYNQASGIQINPDLSSGAPGYSRNVLVANNVIFENKAAAGFNFQGIDSALIMNNLIYNNHNASGITLFHGDASVGCTNVKVFNNTIIIPNDGRWGIHIVDDASNITIYNNILINLHAWKGSISTDAGGYTQTNIISDYNVVSDKFCDVDDGCSKSLLVWQGYGYDLNSILAPSGLTALFANPTGNDYHIIAGSVAVDSGNSAVSADVTDDYDGVGRPVNSKYDIGCYEFVLATAVNEWVSSGRFFVMQNSEGINFLGLEADHIVEVFDMNGRLIGRGRSFSTTSFLQGIYIYSVISQKEGLCVGTGKFFVSCY